MKLMVYWEKWAINRLPDKRRAEGAAIGTPMRRVCPLKVRPTDEEEAAVGHSRRGVKECSGQREQPCRGARGPWLLEC